MKKYLSLLLAFSLVLSLLCVGGIRAEAESITLTDQAGRSVCIEKVPERIVSGYYISSSALIALGLQDRMVGIEAKANKRAIYRLSAPELMELPSVGTAKEFDLEGCIALEPDLVVLPMKLKSVAPTLEELGIAVLLVSPETQEQLEEMIALLGQATGTEEKAEELLGFIADQRTNLEELLADSEKPSVYLAGNSALLSTAGKEMYQSDMLRLAGAVNAADEIEDTYWVEISYEQLLAWDPSYIVIASDADYTAQDVMDDPNLANCSAVKAGNVISLPNKAEAWDSPVPSGILGSVWLASALHSDLLPAEECEDVIEAFYASFYGFAYHES